MAEPYIVQDYMVTSLITLAPEMDVYMAMEILIKERVAGAPVVGKHGKLVGVLSDRDCLNVAMGSGMYDSPAGKVSDYMSKNVVTITPTMDIFQVAKMFKDHNYRRFPVVENEKLVGQVSRRDILAALKDIREKHP